MSTPVPEADRVHAETREQWRRWLAENHQRRTGVWLVSWKQHTGRSRISYDESVEEALCVGWVDSKGRKLDDDRSMLWFAPRKPGSAWARSNKERVARLEAAGLMRPAGRRVVEQAKAGGSWTRLDEVEGLVVPDDLAAAFAARPGSREHWDNFPRSVRRAILEWIVQAKRAETRAKRITETAERAGRGERANQWRDPGGGAGRLNPK
ncbi:MAG TPA: YdeI/OmpD-associated family protein [Micromonosporaceae bacterium]